MFVVVAAVVIITDLLVGPWASVVAVVAVDTFVFLSSGKWGVMDTSEVEQESPSSVFVFFRYPVFVSHEIFPCIFAVDG